MNFVIGDIGGTKAAFVRFEDQPNSKEVTRALENGANEFEIAGELEDSRSERDGVISDECQEIG